MPKGHDNNTSPWKSLPAELRLLILEEILCQRHRGWASCAAVCKGWQVFIEPKNFHQLAVGTSCLDEFERLVIRQRPFVRHISLNVELPRYSCPTCREGTMDNRSSGTFRNAIITIFSILSTWKPTGQLTLELNVSSPSDSEHWFKNYCFGPGHEETGHWTQQDRAIRWHDRKHGWVDGRQVKFPDPNVIRRLFYPFLWKIPKDLPEVHAVTSFLVRRQVRHAILPEILKALWAKLPRLESIVYELWRVDELHTHNFCARELANLLEYAIPKHVKRVTIFKDFNGPLTLSQSREMRYYHTTNLSFSAVDDIPATDCALVKAFAIKSQTLEHLSISYMIDAERVFTACPQLPHAWNLLHSLTLTSPILARTGPRQDIHTLLRNASLTALNMPQLKSMVLWNTEEEQACAVIYQRNPAKGTASLTWRSTWDLELSNDVVESWKKIVPDSRDLRLEKEILVVVDIMSHGDAIHYLRLPDGVVDPGSLQQICQEGLVQ